MYKVTIPSAVADRNFSRTPTNITINSATYPYVTNGTCLDIHMTNLNSIPTLLDQGLELRITATSPNIPENKSYQDLLDDIHDYQCTIASLEGSLRLYKDQLTAIKLCLE
jgi:hypothetical protein